MHRALGCKTPEKMFTRKKPETSAFLDALHIPMSLLRRGQIWSPLQSEASLLAMMRLQMPSVYTFLYKGKLY